MEDIENDDERDEEGDREAIDGEEVIVLEKIER